MKQKNKKTIIILSIVLLCVLVVGITYAYWLITYKQSDKNIATTKCLDISFTDEQNDILLQQQFPITDKEGYSLTPYTFTISNNCNSAIGYQIALEMFDVADYGEISASGLKFAINSSNKKIEAIKLSDKPIVDSTIDGAYESRAIKYGSLLPKGEPGATITYNFRIWIADDADISEANKKFMSKITITAGQGFEVPVESGTLANTILFDNSETGEVPSSLSEHFISTKTFNDSLTTEFYFGTHYTFDESTGLYSLNGKIIKSTLEECKKQINECGKYTLFSNSEGAAITTLNEFTSFENLTYNYFGTLNKISDITKANESFFYKSQDNDGDTYYFRGAPTNNYVQFGSYASGVTVNGETFNTETPMYWRIIRINGDGTVRLIYDGTKLVANGVTHKASIGTSVYDSSNTGFTYDTSSTNKTQINSTVKNTLDTWYDTHMETNFGKYIADSVFCNDKNVSTRLLESRRPKLTCNNTNSYTISADIGNGYLSNPVGLITADEVLMSGALPYRANPTHYLSNGQAYWTMSLFYNSNYGSNRVWRVCEDGNMNDFGLSSTLHVRPVINLKSDVEFTGTGTITDPYIIKTS